MIGIIASVRISPIALVAHGERRMVILRSTFIIDKSGVVRHALYDIKPKGHAAEVLELVRTL
ncbi:MAG: hypothetical protein ABW166_04715 [Sedimenticola sp.]